MRFRRQRTVFVAVIVATLTHGRMARASGDEPRTQAVTGTFRSSPVNAKTRTCTGIDGRYVEIRGMFAGSINSSDPRLTGRLDFSAHALVNQDSGLGTFEGAFQITPARGRQAARGVFYTVVTEGGLNHGFARGKFAAEGDGEEDGERQEEDLFVRFESVVDARLNTTGQIGGTGDPRTPAATQSGHCTGPWTRVP
jgi:hypothetical protein